MKKVLVLALAMMVLAIPAHATTIENLTMRVMEVVELHYDEDYVVCVDAVGFEWEFSECEDYEIGDLVACIMDTMGTDNITDDEILKVQYSGYRVE